MPVSLIMQIAIQGRFGLLLKISYTIINSYIICLKYYS